MRIILTTLLLLTSLNVFADVDGQVENCYDSNFDSKQAAYCADQKILRKIRELEERLEDMEQNAPTPGSKHTVLFSCSDDTDPVLQKTVVSNEGKVLRRDNLLVFSDGSDDQERAACQQDFSNRHFELGKGMTTQCTCSDDTDPQLIIEIINQDYATIHKQVLNTFQVGDDSQEKADCKRMMSELSICK